LKTNPEHLAFQVGIRRFRAHHGKPDPLLWTFKTPDGRFKPSFLAFLSQIDGLQPQNREKKAGHRIAKSGILNAIPRY
jgi:hypothetical protein